MDAHYVEAKAEEVIRKTVDAWNRHDLNAMVEQYSPDSFNMGEDAQQKESEAEKPSKKRPRASSPPSQTSMAKISNLVAKGDIAWFEYEFTGTHAGPYQTPAGPIPQTNRVVKLRVARFERFEHGLIVEERIYGDSADFASQLEPKP